MSFDISRKLPTFRFDKNTAEDVEYLRKITSDRYETFLRDLSETDSDVWISPREVIASIVRVNSQKRQKAFLQVLNGENELPPETVINSIMNYGASIPGVVDEYLEDDYPSHEVFAYNRLGKTSMLNRKFGEKCIEAMRYAYPESDELGQFENLRARVHRVVDTAEGRLAVVSTKETIDRRSYKDRTSMLISRVTGVARMDHESISPAIEGAIETLADYQCDVERLMGAKALLTDFIRENDDSDAVLPVIQTMYQTQG